MTTRILDEKGMMIARTPPMGAGVTWEYTKRDYFQGARRHVELPAENRVHVSTAYFSVVDHRYKIDVSCVVLGAKGEFLGVLAVSATTSPDWNLPDLVDEQRKAILIAQCDQSLPKVEEEDMPPYVILLHPKLGSGEKGPGIDKGQLPKPYDRECGAEYSTEKKEAFEPSTSTEYVDPFGSKHPDYSGPWLAAFAPVGRTGLVVVILQKEE